MYVLDTVYQICGLDAIRRILDSNLKHCNGTVPGAFTFTIFATIGYGPLVDIEALL